MKYSRNLKHSVSWQNNIRCNLKGCGCAKHSFIWVSDKLQCVYYETPKTGSSSIKATMIDSNDNEFYQIKNTPVKSAEIYSTYFKFAVIRDPVSRMLSNYKMFCLSDLDYRHNQIEALFEKPYNQISLEEFIQLTHIYKNHHWEQLVAFLPFSDQKISSLMLDMVLKTDQLQSGWRDVTKKLGIENKLGWKNSTANIIAETRISPESLRFIENSYNDDITLLQEYINNK